MKRFLAHWIVVAALTVAAQSISAQGLYKPCFEDPVFFVPMYEESQFVKPEFEPGKFVIVQFEKPQFERAVIEKAQIIAPQFERAQFVAPEFDNGCGPKRASSTPVRAAFASTSIQPQKIALKQPLTNQKLLATVRAKSAATKLR